MSKAQYSRSIGDIERYYTTVDSLIVSLFKEDRDPLKNKKIELVKLIDNGGEFKKQATDILFEMCVDKLETKYLSKKISRMEHRTG